MAESIIKQTDSSTMTTPVQYFFMSSQRTVTIKFDEHVCVVFGLREGSTPNRLAFIVEYWNANVWHLSSQSDRSGVTVQKSSYSHTFTITTAQNTGVPFIVIGGRVISDVAN